MKRDHLAPSCGPLLILSNIYILLKIDRPGEVRYLALNAKRAAVLGCTLVFEYFLRNLLWELSIHKSNHMHIYACVYSSIFFYKLWLGSTAALDCLTWPKVPEISDAKELWALLVLLTFIVYIVSVSISLSWIWIVRLDNNNNFQKNKDDMEDGRSSSVFSLYWQISQSQMANFLVFIASKSFDLWNHHIPQMKWHNLRHILMY